MGSNGSSRPIHLVFLLKNDVRTWANDDERQLGARFQAAGIPYDYEPTRIVIEHIVHTPPANDQRHPITHRISRTCVTPDFHFEHRNQKIYLELKRNNAKGCIGRLREISRLANINAGIILMISGPKIIHTDLPSSVVAALLRDLNFNSNDWIILSLIPRAA